MRPRLLVKKAQALMKPLSFHYKATLRLGVPIAVGQIGVILVGFADTMMVGHYDTPSLAAASFVNSLFNLVTYLLLGYSYGLTPLVSSLCGRNERAAAGAELKHALCANSLFALALLSAMGVLYFFLDRLGQPAEILPLVRPYYAVVLVSMAFLALFNVLRQFTDGTTDTATGMWVLLAGNALNILFNWLLIFGIGPFPRLGLLGAGISTLFSRVAMTAAMAAAIAFRRRYADFRKGFACIALRREGVRRVNATSLPISLQMGMESGAFTFSGVMAGWLGALELATYQVVVTVSTLGFLLYYSFGAGISIRVAAYAGNGDTDSLRRAAKAGMHILAVMALTVSLVFFTAGGTLLRGFTDDPAVIALALTLIPPLMLYQMGDAMQICYANALRGTARVLPMMWIAFVSYVVVNLPVGYLLAFPCGLGLTGLYLAFSCGLFLAAALFYWQFAKSCRTLS